MSMQYSNNALYYVGLISWPSTIVVVVLYYCSGNFRVLLYDFIYRQPRAFSGSVWIELVSHGFTQSSECSCKIRTNHSEFQCARSESLQGQRVPFSFSIYATLVSTFLEKFKNVSAIYCGFCNDGSINVYSKINYSYNVSWYRGKT